MPDVSDVVEPFPKDVETLHALLRGLLGKRDVTISEIEAAIEER